MRGREREGKLVPATLEDAFPFPGWRTISYLTRGVVRGRFQPLNLYVRNAAGDVSVTWCLHASGQEIREMKSGGHCHRATTMLHEFRNQEPISWTQFGFDVCANGSEDSGVGAGTFGRFSWILLKRRSLKWN